MTELNLSEWIERRIDHIGPHADTIIKGVQEYEDRIEELEDKLEKTEQMLEREIRRVQKIQADFSPPHKVGLNHVEEEYKLMLAELKGEHHE